MQVFLIGTAHVSNVSAAQVRSAISAVDPDGVMVELCAARYVTFRLIFHHFDRFELDLRGHMHVRGAAFSCLRFKLADIVLI